MRSFKIEENGYIPDLGMLFMCCANHMLNILGEVYVNIKNVCLCHLSYTKITPCTTITHAGGALSA